METPSIILNGKEHPIQGINTAAELLESLGMGDKPVVMEIDGQAILPREFESTPLTDGCRIEIVSIVAGG